MNELLTHISVNPASGINREELQLALPDYLLDKKIHLHWVHLDPSGKGRFTITVRIRVNDQDILLTSNTMEERIISEWHHDNPTGPDNARLLALDRILNDPANEDKLLRL